MKMSTEGVPCERFTALQLEDPMHAMMAHR